MNVGLSSGGALLPVKSVAQLEAETKAAVAVRQAKPVISSLVGHVRKRWEEAKDARTDVDLRMTDALRRRRGEYDAQKLAEIKQQGGSEIFLRITGVKCRAALSWLRDTLTGTGTDRPWALSPTPVPDLPPEVEQQLQQQLAAELYQRALMGQIVDPQQITQAAASMRDEMAQRLETEARDRVERMERKIEDQMVQGGWVRAMAAFLDDVVTFPTAIMKGPVQRMRKRLTWANGSLEVVDEVVSEWERVSPFMIYPAPWASHPDDGYLIERHQLTRESLQSMIGVEGYDDDAIRTVLADWETGSLHEWLAIDSMRADAEGKPTEAVHNAGLIDALQLWDSVPGKDLLEWGLPPDEIEDPFRAYPCEVWLIGSMVIRAVLNYEPLGRKPYYATSYEKVPGAFWGNSVVDLVADPQDMANAAARALANNMGISSGPQVQINISRLPADADLTTMYPWKIWQTVYSDFQDSSDPIRFFQPNSNAEELLAVLQKFADLADEYSGIPKYMAGEHVPGAGRTSSGLSMLINNAAKSLKQVVSNIDNDVISPMLERIYQHNARYSDDPDMLGDVNIVARGAMSLIQKEAAAVRRNEFLQLVLNSPVAQQVVGLPGTAELLRAGAQMLDMSPERIVPSRDQIEAQMAMQQQLMMQQAAMQAQQPPQGPEKPPGQGTPPKPKSAPTQPDGSRVGGRDVNNFSPRPHAK